MSTVAKNIMANYAGRIWTGLIGLVLVPLYIRFLGIEAYGLIGVYLSLTGLLSVMDMGLGATLNRELARLSASQDTGQEARNLVRTMELVYWGMGILIGAGIFVLAPLIARHWINVQVSSMATVEQAVILMGIVAALEWPGALYTGGLTGLQRQVLLNGVVAGTATIKSVGVVLVLWLVSPTITAFFKWQMLISALQTALLAAALWSALPDSGEGSAFRGSLLVRNWRFAAGMTGITVIVTVLTQIDKILLSKLLTLEAFGYYVLAFNAAGLLTHLVNPVFTALFPRFSQLAMGEGGEGLSSLYHKGCQLLSLVVLPAALTMAFFSREVLMLWIGNSATADRTYVLFGLLLIGTTMNALMTIPYALQVAFGWTRLIFLQNLVGMIFLVPALVWMIRAFGPNGAAIVWIILNLGYVAIMIPMMHRRLLKDEMWRWYLVDVGIPLAIVISVCAASRALLPAGIPSGMCFLWIAATLLVSLLLSSLSLKSSRDNLTGFAVQAIDALRNRK